MRYATTDLAFGYGPLRWGDDLWHVETLLERVQVRRWSRDPRTGERGHPPRVVARIVDPVSERPFNAVLRFAEPWGLTDLDGMTLRLVEPDGFDAVEAAQHVLRLGPELGFAPFLQLEGRGTATLEDLQPRCWEFDGVQVRVDGPFLHLDRQRHESLPRQDLQAVLSAMLEGTFDRRSQAVQRVVVGAGA